MSIKNILRIKKIKLFIILIPICLILPNIVFGVERDTFQIAQNKIKEEKQKEKKPIPPEAKKHIDEMIEKLKKGEWVNPESFSVMVKGYHDYPGFKKNLESIIDPLINKQNKNYKHREYYALCLYFIKDKKAIPYLKKALKDGKWKVKQYSAFALYYLGEAELAFSAFEELLKNENKFARGSTINSLKQIEDERAEKLIEKMLNDPDKTVAEDAKRALEKIKKREKKNQ